MIKKILQFAGVALAAASLLFGAGLFSVGAFAAEDSADEWLKRMNSAFTQLDYDGYFSFLSGSNISSLRVVHVVDNGVQRERLVHLNGAPREMIRDGDEVTCILQPGDRLVALGGNIPAGPFADAFIRDFGQVSKNYDLKMRGEGRIAARLAVRMVVEPRDKYRYGYRIWLDKETGLLLKSELMDENWQTALEVFQFNQLKLGADVDKASLAPEQPNGSVVDHFKVADTAAGEGHPDVHWRAKWLPKGFAMASSDMRKAAATQQDINTLMFSDGLAAVSVFVEDMPKSAATNMLSRNGATVSVTRLVLGPDKKQHLVTVIGEVPPEAATAIATNMSYKN